VRSTYATYPVRKTTYLPHSSQSRWHTGQAGMSAFSMSRTYADPLRRCVLPTRTDPATEECWRLYAAFVSLVCPIQISVTRRFCKMCCLFYDQANEVYQIVISLQPMQMSWGISHILSTTLTSRSLSFPYTRRRERRSSVMVFYVHQRRYW
jgi:hypothetical protein